MNLNRVLLIFVDRHPGAESDPHELRKAPMVAVRKTADEVGTMSYSNVKGGPRKRSVAECIWQAVNVVA